VGAVLTIIKEERIGGQRLLLGDCLEVMPLLEFDAIISDPPYGIGMSGGNVGYKGFNDFARKEWDASPPDMAISVISSNGKPYILWGGNYFLLPPSRCYLVWDKGAGFKGRSYAESELAMTNIDANARTFSHDPLAKGDYKGKLHPTQKPVALMEWCIGFLPNAQTILDPFMGSGTTLVACQKLGRSGIGIELDPDYFAIACKRVEEATRQPDMFVTPPAPAPTQEGFDL
jgi:DNA modification methylase